MLRDALLDAWSLLLPVECAGCGAVDRDLCTTCRDAVRPILTAQLCGRLSVVSALRYEDRVRRVILAFKESGRTDVANALAVPLAVAIAEASASSGVGELVAVPTSRAAYRRRGYDPVRLLLARAGARTASLLEHVGSAQAQKSLGVEGRADNRVRSVVARRRLEGHRVLLIDDIVTTGATLVECARAVEAAGGEVLGAVTLAFTPRLLPVRDNRGGRDYGGGKGARLTAW